MKEEKKVFIHSVLNDLQLRDPAWKHAKMIPKLKVLYYGWRQKELRAKIRSGYFYSISWKRGWLSQADFVRFRDYAMQ